MNVNSDAHIIKKKLSTYPITTLTIGNSDAFIMKVNAINLVESCNSNVYNPSLLSIVIFHHLP